MSSPNFINKPARTRQRQIDHLDRSLDRVTDYAVTLFLVGLTILAVMVISAIAYTIWDRAIGHWAFKFDRWVFPVVGAIILSSQLSRRKAHLHITNLHKDV